MIFHGYFNIILTSMMSPSLASAFAIISSVMNCKPLVSNIPTLSDSGVKGEYEPRHKNRREDHS